MRADRANTARSTHGAGSLLEILTHLDSRSHASRAPARKTSRSNAALLIETKRTSRLKPTGRLQTE